MPRASLETLQKRRADAAREKMREEAETPAGDTAEDLVTAGEKYRKFDAAAREPDERTINELLTKYPDLFRAFLASKNIEIQENKPLSEQQMKKLPEARVEFLERVEYAEYVKTLITPEVLQTLIDHGFTEKSLALKKLLDLSKPEAVAVVVQDSLLSMACKEPERFDKLAQSLEMATAHKRTNHYQEAEQKALGTLNKFKAGGNYEALLEASNKLPQKEYAQMLRNQVIESKGIFRGAMQRAVDEKFEARKEELASLTFKRDKLLQEIEKATDVFEDLEDEVAKLMHLAYLERDHEEEHPVHDELAEAKGRRNDAAEKLTSLVEIRTKFEKRIKLLTKANDVLEKKTSYKQAGDLAEQVRQTDSLMEEVKGYEQTIGTTLAEALVKSPLLREGVNPFFFNTHPAITEAAKTPADTREARERMLAKAIPTQEALQGEFNRFVLQRRADGFSGAREELMGDFVKKETEHVSEQHKRKVGAERKEGWLSRLFASMFAPRRIRANLEEKRKNLH